MSSCPRNDDRIRRLFRGKEQASKSEPEYTHEHKPAQFYCNSGNDARIHRLFLNMKNTSAAESTPRFDSGMGGVRNRTIPVNAISGGSGTGIAVGAGAGAERRPTYTPEQIAGIDLNIENYTIHDLCNLFSIPPTFGLDDLKRAYKQTLMTHPDKSRYPKEVFLFFSKAFRTVKSVYDFRNKTETTYESLVDARGDLGDYLRERTGAPSAKQAESIIKSIQGRDDFNSWFNESFEKARLKNDFNDTGYNEWFRGATGTGAGAGAGAGGAGCSTHYSADDVSSEYEGVGGSKDRMNEVFERKRREARAIVVHNQIDESGLGAFGSGITASSIDGEKPGDYSSSMFSRLAFEDLYKAHTETVVPVSEEEDYHKRPQFRNVDEYNRYRASMSAKPMSREDAEAELMRKYAHDTLESDNRAMRLIKQEQDAIAKMKEVWGSALRLTEQ